MSTVCGRGYVGDGPRRIWFYGSSWDGPPVCRGGDEYGQNTVVLRAWPLPLAMVIATSPPVACGRLGCVECNL